MRIRMLVTTYHPEAGGSRRQGEVLELEPELAAHWIRQNIAADATGMDLSGPRYVEPNVDEPWDLPPLGDDPLGGTIVNSDDRPSPALQKIGMRRQKRD